MSEKFANTRYMGPRVWTRYANEHGERHDSWVRGRFDLNSLVVLLAGGSCHGIRAQGRFHSEGVILAEGSHGAALYRVYSVNEDYAVAVPFDATQAEIHDGMLRLAAMFPKMNGRARYLRRLATNCRNMRETADLLPSPTSRNGRMRNAG